MRQARKERGDIFDKRERGENRERFVEPFVRHEDAGEGEDDEGAVEDEICPSRQSVIHEEVAEDDQDGAQDEEGENALPLRNIVSP